MTRLQQEVRRRDRRAFLSLTALCGSLGGTVLAVTTLHPLAYIAAVALFAVATFTMPEEL